MRTTKPRRSLRVGLIMAVATAIAALGSIGPAAAAPLVDALRKVPGRDYLTLLTCTPIGVNSHRLLVRGERIATEESDDSQRFAANAQDPGFPWWSVPLAVAAGSSIWIAWPARGRPRRSAQG